MKPVPKISIIIPVYNAAAYIEQCIRSVLNQTMKDVEVIAVNDGSTDEGKEILDRLAATDKRLHVFHRNNNGVSATRNFGLQQATGTYIGFCDADDFLEAGMLEALYRETHQKGCDWVICNAYVVKEGMPVKTRLSISDEVVNVRSDKASFVHQFMRFTYDYANWNKLYKASIIKDNNLRFFEDMSVGEDLLFNLQYLTFVEHALILSQPLYNYRITDGSLYNSNSKDRIPQINKLYQNYRSSSYGIIGEPEREAFCREMARITYNQLLYEIEQRMWAKSKNLFMFLINHTKELKRLDAGLFYFSYETQTGFQRFKKKLLIEKRFFLFSCVAGAKRFLKKPVKFVLTYFKRG